MYPGMYHFKIQMTKTNLSLKKKALPKKLFLVQVFAYQKRVCFGFGNYDLEFICDLVLGFWDFLMSRQERSEKMAALFDLPTGKWLSFFDVLGTLAVQRVTISGGELWRH